MISQQMQLLFFLIGITHKPQNSKNESHLARATWRVFITTRRIIQKPRKLGWKACIAWCPIHASRRFIPRT